MKKPMSLILVFVIFTMVVSTAFSYHVWRDEEQTNKSEEKEYCKATLEDSFEEDAVGVVLKHDVSLKAKTYTKDDFPISGIKEVEDLTQYYVDAIRNGEFEKGNESDISKFHQILRLTLVEKSKENVLRVVKELEKLDFVLSAEP